MPISIRLVDSLQGLSSFALPHMVFRGQRSADWSLLSSLDRCLSKHNVQRGHATLVESELNRQFRRAYHQYATHLPRDRAVLEWLSIMQHYGAPTRLLDFSYSIWVAAYFALEEAESDCCVWAVKDTWTLHETIVKFHNADKQEADLLSERFEEEHEERIEALFYEPKFINCVCAVNPFRLNDRLRLQKGVFLIQGNVMDTFENNLKAMRGYDDSTNVVKIVLLKRIHQDAIRQLFDMNISRTTLFPGLDGFAQSLQVYHPAFDPKWLAGFPAQETSDVAE